MLKNDCMWHLRTWFDGERGGGGAGSMVELDDLRGLFPPALMILWFHVNLAQMTMWWHTSEISVTSLFPLARLKQLLEDDWRHVPWTHWHHTAAHKHVGATCDSQPGLRYRTADWEVILQPEKQLYLEANCFIRRWVLLALRSQSLQNTMTTDLYLFPGTHSSWMCIPEQCQVSEVLVLFRRIQVMAGVCGHGHGSVFYTSFSCSLQGLWIWGIRLLR